MKKGTLLNSQVSSLIASMGHTESLTIADAGLAVPDSVQKIDLAVSRGIPALTELLAAVLDELCIERVVFPEEIRTENPEGLDEIQDMLVQYESETGYKPAMVFIPYDDFRSLAAESKAHIRTGEARRFTDMILYSGVVF